MLRVLRRFGVVAMWRCGIIRPNMKKTLNKLNNLNWDESCQSLPLSDTPQHFGERLKAAMVRAGYSVEKESAKTLQAAWMAAYPAMPISRQRCYDWLRSPSANIHADRLFFIADMLDVSARWLAKGEKSIFRAVELSADEKLLLDTFRSMTRYAQKGFIAGLESKPAGAPKKKPARRAPKP